MNCLYSLYDALIGIEVPAEKARAVVGAIEQDMSSNFATKADIQGLEQRVGAQIHGLEQRVGHEFELVRRDMKALESSMASGLKEAALNLKALERSMIAKLGVMVAGGLTLLFAALQLA